jgi:nucleotide-binding universal stress UspA family protein
VHEPIAGVYLRRAGTFEATLDRDLIVNVRDYLDSAVNYLAEKTGLGAKPIVLKGPISETIARHATASGADLLVMTTQGRGPLGRMWFGSVADALVRQSPIPILFVRPTETSARKDDHVIRHVLIPLDGSQFSEQALEPALALGGADGEFTLLRVIPALTPVAYEPTSGRVSGLSNSVLQQLQELKREQEAEATEYLEQFAARLRARSVKVRTTQLVAYEQPAVAILNAAASLGVDAIAMTTRGQSGIKRLLLGSIADKVIRGASIPVLVCPPEVAAERSST